MKRKLFAAFMISFTDFAFILLVLFFPLIQTDQSSSSAETVLLFLKKDGEKFVFLSDKDEIIEHIESVVRDKVVLIIPAEDMKVSEIRKACLPLNKVTKGVFLK